MIDRNVWRPQLTQLPGELRRSLTWGQGTEVAQHPRFTVATGCPVFFCDPTQPLATLGIHSFAGTIQTDLDATAARCG